MSRIMLSSSSSDALEYLFLTEMLNSLQGRSQNVNRGGYLFIYSCSAQLVSFEIQIYQFEKKLLGQNMNI